MQISKKGIITEYLPWLIIGIAVLVIVLFFLFIMKNQGTSLVDQIKNLFTFGKQ